MPLVLLLLLLLLLLVLLCAGVMWRLLRWLQHPHEMLPGLQLGLGAWWFGGALRMMAQADLVELSMLLVRRSCLLLARRCLCIWWRSLQGLLGMK